MSFLVARPASKAYSTQQALQEAGFTATVAPVINIHISQNAALTQDFQNKPVDIIIFTSTHAVEWLTQQALTITKSTIKIICVGQATAKALASVLSQDIAPNPNIAAPNITAPNIIVPKSENSEGMIALPILNAVSKQSILILKGEGGRELLGNILRSRGAKVRELAVYKRVINPVEAINEHNNYTFKQAHIHCIIATSVEIAQALLDIYDENWLQKLPWMVASERIKDYAKQRGINTIFVSKGASNQAIVECATHLVHTGVVND